MLSKAISQPDPAESRLDEILTAVRGVFAQKGFAGSSMQDLARAAGMSAGNFYRYFSSKDAIIETMVRREIEMIETEFQRVITAPDPRAALFGVLHRELVSFDEADCAIWMEIEGLAQRADAISRMHQDLLVMISDYLVALFARFRNIPLEAARLQYRGHAEMIIILVQGLRMHRVRNGGEVTPGVAELAQQTLDLYLTEAIGEDGSLAAPRFDLEAPHV